VFVIQGCRVFDGTRSVGVASVVVEGATIVGVEQRIAVPAGARVIDGRGKTLLPGLIDAHAHPQPPALEEAIVFGVTTELDMFSAPEWMLDQRRQAAVRNDMADVRSASIGATVRGGHPAFLMAQAGFEVPTIDTVEEVADFVAARVAEGADYIKLIVDDGAALGNPLPALTPELTEAIVDEAHRHNLMALAHVMTQQGARQSVDAGIDGLAHAFIDAEPDAELIGAIAERGVFVISTLSTWAR
jgi:imidazolonepropionase-like amidohydrolase